MSIAQLRTIYEIDTSKQRNWAQAVYNFRWTPQTDPQNHNVLKNVRIPIRPHFGVMGLAPKEADIVDSIPPSYFGGNMDNWRVGKGATMYYPIAVPGGLFSVGDSHAAQGDSELCGTAIEMSLTGTFQLIGCVAPRTRCLHFRTSPVDHWACYAAPPADDLSVTQLCRRRRLAVVRCRSHPPVRAGRSVCGSYPARDPVFQIEVKAGAVRALGMSNGLTASVPVPALPIPVCFPVPVPVPVLSVPVPVSLRQPTWIDTYLIDRQRH
jgi:Acetamidase/Formamidase family